ncbi:helicase-associated domain-containing protein [Paenibacillus caui]|uniref:helicase-associated domain-containing protein n=1 Tax=Paenibacillus caui TaxID=2873927 RepID=UPI001CA84137|nr:helicase-associated domain-containing protein [Paenibacillus caui]
MNRMAFDPQTGVKAQPDSLAARTLHLVFLRFAAQPFSLEQLEGLATAAAGGGELAYGLQLLRRTRTVLAVQKAWGDKLYYIPLGIFLALQTERFRNLLPAGEGSELRESPDSADISLWKESKPGLASDLFRALSWIARGGLPLTAKGTVHQRAMSKFAGLLSLSSEDVESLKLRYPQQESYPAAAAVMLDMALSLGLAERGDQEWTVCEPALSRWLAYSREEMDSRLLYELLARYVPASSGLQHAACALMLPCFKAGIWYSVPSLLKQLRLRNVLSQEENQEDDGELWLQGWMEALCAFGWLELGYSRHKELFFRWHRKPSLEDGVPGEQAGAHASRSSSAFFVQPDFEVLVPPDTPYSLRWELELCCEMSSSDVMTTYRLTRQAAEAALEQKRTPEDILGFLTRHAMSGVPDNVKLALRQWGREMGRTSFARALLLRCADAEAADRIAQDSGLSGMMQRIGPLDFIVQETELGEIRRGLERLGVAPLGGSAGSASLAHTANASGSSPRKPAYPRLEMPSDGGDAETGRTTPFHPDKGGEAQHRPSAWIYAGNAVHFYQPDETVPDYEELFPGLRNVPGSWTRELRGYHASTVALVLRQALEWKARVELRIQGKTLMALLLWIRGAGEWRASAMKDEASTGLAGEDRSFEFASHDVEGIRIVLPAKA